ncbi:MAG: peptidase [Flavobacterium sp.]|nr:peptidase [Pedobacter sp.]
MKQKSKICYDRILPKDLQRPLPGIILDLAKGSHPGMEFRTRLAFVTKKKWVNGTLLRVKFVGGTADQHDIVKKYAIEWSTYGNIKFDFGNSLDSEIRIAFENDGAWSYIGTDCLSIPRNTHTMNFGWLDQGVVLHEFGHALGMIHEHQNPLGGIQWNKPEVYEDLGGSPNFWDKATIDNNMFKTYDKNQINGTNLDQKSIMLYSIPGSWTTDGFSSQENKELSVSDKAFMGDVSNYPFTEKPIIAIALPLSASHITQADISKSGEEDLFTFTVTNQGKYVIKTKGQTDVIMNLYGPDSQTNLLDQDNDSGYRLNAKIVLELLPGKYFVQIRHFNSRNGTGKYGISVYKKRTLFG